MSTTQTTVNGASTAHIAAAILAQETQHQQVAVVAQPPSHPLIPAGRFDMSPQSLDEAYDLADRLANSTMVPKDYINKPGNVLVAIQWGWELGLKPLQAMQNIAVINGRPSLWGDAVMALVQASPLCEDVVEYYEGAGDSLTAICIAKRRGRADKVGVFSVELAKKAKLWTKAGPWQDYPERMLKMRARAFALRDQFADVLKGMLIAEEQQDIPADGGPDGRLNHGNTRPATVKGSAIVEGNRPALSEDGAAVIVTLTRIAKTEGYAAMKVEWQKLTKEMREEIGVAKRDEIGALGHAFDAARKASATDATDVSAKADA